MNRKNLATATATAALVAGTMTNAPTATAAVQPSTAGPPQTVAVNAIPARGSRHRHSGYPWARWAGDINVPGSVDYGNPVRSRWAGRVLSVRRWSYSYGWHITVRHRNRRSTLYAHLSRILVRPGQRVRFGQVIGRVGSTGNSSGPHLHFEIR